MKKFIVLLMALVLFFVPFGSAFAYTGGLLNGKQINRGPDHNTVTQKYSTVTDNDETSPISLQASGSEDTFWYEFTTPVSIDSIAMKFSGSGNMLVTMYDSNNVQIYSNEVANTNGQKTAFSSVKNNVKKVAFTNISSTFYTVYEIDVFAPVVEPPSLISGKSFTNYSGTPSSALTDGSLSTYLDLTNASSSKWSYSFNTPVSITDLKVIFDTASSSQPSITFFDESGVSIKSTAIVDANYNVKMPYEVPNVSKVQISGNSSSFVRTYEFSLYGQENSVQYDDVTNLTLSATQNSVDLNWSIPSGNADFTGTKIYRNGTFLESVNSSTKTFTDSNLSADTNYTYKITAVYSDGHETAGISESVTTKSPPPPDRDGDGIPDDEDEFPDDPTNTPPSVEVGEVKNLEITTTYKSANLSWVLPKSENLQHVNIYRETLTQETSFMNNFINGKTVYAAGEKIFETNGTYFNDYTVEPGTEYEYKVTTTSVDGVESEGITARTTTPGKPLVDFEEVSLPFSVKDLLLSGNGLLLIIGPFILLALAFLLVPKLRNLILGAFRKDSKGISEAAERRTKAEAIQKMERQEAKEFRTAREPKSERVEVAAKPIREPKELKQPRIREPKERIRTAKLTRERIREPRAPRASREPRAPRERTRKPRDRRGIS